jgi:hypothetical protein
MSCPVNGDAHPPVISPGGLTRFWSPRIENINFRFLALKLSSARERGRGQRLKGVSLEKGRGKPWRATIRAAGKAINLGRFDTAGAAHKAYLVATKAMATGKLPCGGRVKGDAHPASVRPSA